jgi:uncharacterized repeat protein (TIGR01451 family)
MTRFGKSVLVVAVMVLSLLAASTSALGATITSSGPLTNIGISDQLNCSVNHTSDAAGEFYGDTACGTLVAVGGALFGPASIPAGGSASPRTPFTPVSQSTVTGTGTSADPYRVVTVVDLGTTGLRITETDSYVVGDESYRTDVQVANSGTASQDAILYRAGDCFLQSSDVGFGSVDTATGAVACTAGTAPGSRIEQWFPISPGSHYYEAGYSEVWAQIGGQQSFPDTCRCAEFIDNGAGLSWNITIPAGGSVTRSHLTTFSPLGRLPLSTTKTADAATVGAGAADGYTITVSNPNVGAVTLSSITDTLPAGFTYTAGSTTGATTADPSITGQTLTWAGPFTVPAATGATPGTLTLHFGVTVSSTPGDYFNNAGAESADFTVAPTGDTARITVQQSATGMLEVRKVLSPADDPGRFNLQIDNQTKLADAGNGATTGKQTVSASSHTVGETAGTAAALGDYTSTISCKDQGGAGSEIASASDAGPLSVNVAPSADVVCTISNTRKVVGGAIGRITGGGTVVGTSVHHGFELYCDKTKSPNNLEVNWGHGNRFHLVSLTSAACSDDPSISEGHPVAGFDTYRGTGTGTYNGTSGATAEWVMTDAGEPGKNDRFQIKITDASGNVVLDVSGKIKGNHQAHPE